MENCFCADIYANMQNIIDNMIIILINHEPIVKTIKIIV